MDYKSNQVYTELNNLISRSCTQLSNVSSKNKKFHIALLKFYFNCKTVDIDYHQHKIVLVNPKRDVKHSNQFFSVSHQSRAVEVTYDDLAIFLRNCINYGEVEERFYKSLLFHHNTVLPLQHQSSILVSA